jgi:ubiquinone/menaquinone biosynthesis C-methylase UbiE
VITDLAEAALAPGGRRARVADIGCGRGTTTRMLAQRLPDAVVTGLDLSAALLAAARGRQPEASAVRFIRADFCHLPLASRSCHVMVAAFCLYHCAVPGQVIGEIGRCLRPGGTAILVTKSADSYRELDELLAAAGLDPGALSRPGLYDTAHSGNLAALAAAHLSVQHVMHHAHRFTFSSFADAAEYLATSPKYQLPAGMAGDPAAPRRRAVAGHRYQMSPPRFVQPKILQAATVAHASFFGKSRLLVKSPFNSFRIGQIEALWGTAARYIHIVRDRRESADSMRRNRFEFLWEGRLLTAEEAWQMFTSAVCEYAPAGRLATVTHRELLADPDGVVAGILGWLGIGGRQPATHGDPRSEVDVDLVPVSCGVSR